MSAANVVFFTQLFGLPAPSTLPQFGYLNAMKYVRMPIEVESPEELGYNTILHNLAESSLCDLSVADLPALPGNLLLAYGDHKGIPQLRQLIAEDGGISDPSHVLLTPGAAGALFFVNTSILSKEKHLLVMHPNYATNFETPRAIGCGISYIKLLPEKPLIRREEILGMIQPNTAMISVTTPHNPTGKCIPEDDMNWLIERCEEKQIYLLVDETYRSIPIGKKPGALYASRSKMVISVSSLSKAFGLPGLRIGWAVTSDKNLYHTLLAAKEQVLLGNPVVDEALALEAMKNKDFILKSMENHLQTNMKLLTTWMRSETRIQVPLPEGGCVCFCKLPEAARTKVFYEVLYHGYKTYVGPGHWFEQEDHYFRLGFGWPKPDSLEQGLLAISAALDEALRK
ncbi:MAG: pyridoxal phosphate-dependent aminotransferase [Bacteroidota bacterium]